MSNSLEFSEPDKKHKVCPWWVAYLFDNPLRRKIHPPEEILSPYVKKGMTVLDLGCGFGHFALGMAGLVGESGTVIAADIQEKMLCKVRKRAKKSGVGNIIVPVRRGEKKLAETESLDFVLASNSLHETEDKAGTLEEIFWLLRPGGRFLLMEPSMHLKEKDFEAETRLAEKAGFKPIEPPFIRREMCALFEKVPAMERLT